MNQQPAATESSGVKGALRMKCRQERENKNERQHENSEGCDSVAQIHEKEGAGHQERIERECAADIDQRQMVSPCRLHPQRAPVHEQPEPEGAKRQRRQRRTTANKRGEGQEDAESIKRQSNPEQYFTHINPCVGISKTRIISSTGRARCAEADRKSSSKEVSEHPCRPELKEG